MNHKNPPPLRGTPFFKGGLSNYYALEKGNSSKKRPFLNRLAFQMEDPPLKKGVALSEAKGRGIFEYSIIRSPRARHMRITVYPTGEVKVTASRLIPEFLIKRFVERKSDWINKKVEYFKKHPVSAGCSLLRTQNRTQFRDNKAKALELVTARLKHFNEHYNLVYNKITIRNQKSRWGSCSHRGNISFNYKIVFLPPAVQDYIVVHELCHLKEMNHSKDFWNLVAEKMPEWKMLRRKLKIV